MMLSSSPFLVPLALWSLISQTFILQSTALKLQTRSIPTSHFSRRAPISGSQNSSDTVPLNDKQNVKYIANITIGGSPFEVMIDSGSADLWVSGTVKQSHDLNVTAGVQYAVGNANGNINTAQVQFGGHTIQDQAFILVKDASTFQPDFLDSGMNGLIGLGPGQGSVVRNTLGNSTGDSFLDRVFAGNTSTPNFISFLLQRNGDPTDVPGELTIGEVISGYESISSQKKLPVQVLKDTDQKMNQHWTVQLDPNGIIGPDGQAIKKSSIVPNNNGQLFAVIDSGFTLPQVPRSVSDAIYGRVQGANYSTQYNLWTIPCEQELNISFVIGGVTFPVHPLDTSSTDFNLKDANGKPVCAGTFQPITSAFSLAGEFDLILGMSFLRNAYTLLDFGDFVDGSASTVGDPYVQLLSTTVPSTAHADFVNVRLGGKDTTNLPQYALLPANKGKSSPVPLNERVEHTEQKVIRYMPEIIACSVGGFLILVGLCVWRYIRRRRARAAKQREINKISQPSNYYDDQFQQPSQPIYLNTFGAQSQTFGNKQGYDSYHSDYYYR